jgi:hypothetical protein
VRRLFFVLLSLGLMLLLGGCVGDGAPDGDLAVKVENQLIPEEATARAIVDFDSLVEGDWTQMALVCGASDSTIAEALGFAWEQPSRSEVRVGYAYVFATEDAVEQFFGPVTWAPFDDRSYVSPCDWSAEDPVSLLLFERDDAVISYEFRDNPTYVPGTTWFPSPGQGTAFYGSRWS